MPTGLLPNKCSGYGTKTFDGEAFGLVFEYPFIAITPRSTCSFLNGITLKVNLIGQTGVWTRFLRFRNTAYIDNPFYLLVTFHIHITSSTKLGASDESKDEAFQSLELSVSPLLTYSQPIESSDHMNFSPSNAMFSKWPRVHHTPIILNDLMVFWQRFKPF